MPNPTQVRSGRLEVLREWARENPPQKVDDILWEVRKRYPFLTYPTQIDYARTILRVVKGGNFPKGGDGS